MSFISPNSWKPIGVLQLEPTAEDVVRSTESRLVVAGPGSGKTELLAQRAAFLLQTGICFPPRRILAISFKRDAASNLSDRVSKRIGLQANCFDSFTIDAFAKSLVDRFRQALPEEWRPIESYGILEKQRIEILRDWLQSTGSPKGPNEVDWGRFADKEIRYYFDRMAHGFRLPYDGDDVNSLARHLGVNWWNQQLALSPGEPALSFPMICRLAAFLIRENPKLRKAIQSTYGYVFLDEFQDTTSAQYDLIVSAFKGSEAIFTAVGDSKQRIMVWAGAVPEIFDDFLRDFDAKRCDLIRNYRSAPELVRMQHVIAQATEPGTIRVEAANLELSGSCEILHFSDANVEAAYIAEMISHGIYVEGRNPRDFCILVRQNTSQMIAQLTQELEARKVKLRDETLLQDLFSEPLVKLIMLILRIVTRKKDPDAWSELCAQVAFLYGIDETYEGKRLEYECGRLLTVARSVIDKPLEKCPELICSSIGISEIKSKYQQYRNENFLSKIIKDLSRALLDSSKEPFTPIQVVNSVLGIDSVPAMTIHKSKGLEFHTVFLMGLEDSQWWAYTDQPEEEKCNFFVAFSRAKEQIFFTYSDYRMERWGNRRQFRHKIADLYEILNRVGVKLKDCVMPPLFEKSIDLE